MYIINLAKYFWFVLIVKCNLRGKLLSHYLETLKCSCRFIQECIKSSHYVKSNV